MASHTVDTQNLTESQKDFTIHVMSMIINNLIQDSMDLGEDGLPLPANKQTDQTIAQAMTILNYK